MGSSSLSPFSLYSQPDAHDLKFPKQSLHPTVKPPETTHANKHRLLFLNLKPQPSVPFHKTNKTKHLLSPKSSHFLSNPTQSSLHYRPTSNLSKISCYLTPRKNNLRFLSEKVVVLLVGSFIFMGFLGPRPVVALPAQKSEYSEHMEKKRETKNGQNENEEMHLKILEKDPRNVDALKVVVYLRMRNGRTKEAVEYVERLIDVEPDEVEWRLLQALCYEMMGQLTKAKRLFKEILEERPLLLRALHGLAMVMHKNFEGPAVFQMLDKALEVACREKRVTEERNIRILIAQMHVVKGDLEEGLKNFQVLVNENPRDFRPYLCQGIIYSLLDKKKEAEENFETYRSLVPEEFPQRGFLDDVVLSAKTKPREGLWKEFDAEFSC